MANTRIKDISTAATTLNSDDFIAVDGSTAGTRKMAKADLITEVSTGVSGTYLEESNNLSDVASKDTSKLNLEVPDVGSQPNQTPLNLHLGSLAYADADSVSVGQLSADGKTTLTNDQDNALVVQTENKNPMFVNVIGSAPNYLFDVRDDDTSKFRVDGSGRVGISNSSPDHPLTLTANPGAANTPVAWLHNSGNVSEYDGTVISTVNDGSDVEVLHVRTNTTTYDGGASLMLVRGDGNVGIGTSSPSAPLSVENSSNPKVTFGYGGSNAEHRLAWDSSKFYISADAGNAAGSSEIGFFVDNVKRFAINASGNLVVSSGGAIDFGTTTTGTGTVATNGGLLDDYERGTATPTDASGGGLTLSGEAMNYVKIGSQVTAWVKVIYPTNSDTNSSAIGGFPFAFGASDIDRVGGSISYTTLNSALTVLADNPSSLVRFRKLDGGTYTNAELSGKQVWFSVTYDVS